MVKDRLARPDWADQGLGAVKVASQRALGVVSARTCRYERALAVVNGAFGDRLADRGSPLAIRMTFRSGTLVLPLDRDGLMRELPAATTRIVLLVHGLMGTDSVWGFPGDPDTNYGSLLARDQGVTPVWLCYNTGRHISTNGWELATLLHRLTAAWPVPVTEITLIGHSMGGLVIRSACHYASVTRPWRGLGLFGRSWTSRVRRVVLIGVPNTGAPLEVFANRASATLWALPIPATRLVGFGLDARSAGIKDLRFGSITDEDWLEQDPDVRERPVPHRAEGLKGASYLVIAGSVTTDPAHRLTRLIGDALVTPSSASGTLDPATQAGLFPGCAVRLFPKVTHLALLNRPEIYDAISQWWPDPTVCSARGSRLVNQLRALAASVDRVSRTRPAMRWIVVAGWSLVLGLARLGVTGNPEGLHLADLLPEKELGSVTERARRSWRLPPARRKG